MNSRERVLAALNLQEPDRVPFMDFVDNVVKQKIMGADEIDEAGFANKLGMDAIYFVDYCTPLFCKSQRDDGDIPKAFGMTGETENRRFFAFSCPEVCHVAKYHRLAIEAERLQPAGQNFLATGIVGRDRGSPQQLLEQRDRRVHFQC